jgi:hypothetical protein
VSRLIPDTCDNITVPISPIMKKLANAKLIRMRNCIPGDFAFNNPFIWFFYFDNQVSSN